MTKKDLLIDEANFRELVNYFKPRFNRINEFKRGDDYRVFYETYEVYFDDQYYRLNPEDAYRKRKLAIDVFYASIDLNSIAHNIVYHYDWRMIKFIYTMLMKLKNYYSPCNQQIMINYVTGFICKEFNLEKFISGDLVKLQTNIYLRKKYNYINKLVNFRQIVL